MSKFLCLGMPLADVIAASTVNAAMALKRPELGSLKPGSVGDATILTVKEGRFDYVDVVGEHLEGDRKIASEGVVVARPLVASELGRRLSPRGTRGRGSLLVLVDIQNIGVAGPSITPVSDLRHALGAWNWPSGT